MLYLKYVLRLRIEHFSILIKYLLNGLQIVVVSEIEPRLLRNANVTEFLQNLVLQPHWQLWSFEIELHLLQINFSCLVMLNQTHLVFNKYQFNDFCHSLDLINKIPTKQAVIAWLTQKSGG